jgi:hypothetical protein
VRRIMHSDSMADQITYHDLSNTALRSVEPAGSQGVVDDLKYVSTWIEDDGTVDYIAQSHSPNYKSQIGTHSYINSSSIANDHSEPNIRWSSIIPR